MDTSDMGEPAILWEIERLRYICYFLSSCVINTLGMGRSTKKQKEKRVLLSYNSLLFKNNTLLVH